MRDYNQHNKIVKTSEEEMPFSEVFPAFPTLIRKVYLWMACGLAITGLTAYMVATDEVILQLVYGNSAIFFGLLIIEFILAVGTTMLIDKLSLMTATIIFVVYAMLNGVTMASLFLLYTQSSIATVFFITAATFGTMSAWGYTTGIDLSSMGKLLHMGLLGVIIATIVNIFLQNDRMTFILSYLGIIVFVGLTAYDTQKIKGAFISADEDSEDNQKIALLGALTLYLDFINLFLYLLRILGKRR